MVSFVTSLTTGNQYDWINETGIMWLEHEDRIIKVEISRLVFDDCFPTADPATPTERVLQVIRDRVTALASFGIPDGVQNVLLQTGDFPR